MKRRYWQIMAGIVLVWSMMLCATYDQAQALSLFGKSTYDEAVAAWDKKDYERSAILSQKALREDPASPAVKKLLGWNYIKLGRANEAEHLFLEAGQIKGDDIGVTQGLAWVYAEQGKNEAAQAAFQQEIAWAKKFMDRNDWSYFSADDQSYIQSIFSDGHYGLGQLAYRMGNYQAASDFMTTSLKFNNQFTPESELYLARGDNFWADGKLEKALNAYEQASSADKKNLTAQLKQAWSLHFLKRYAAAQMAFEKAIFLNPAIAEGVYGLGLSQYQEGKFGQARTNLAAAIKIYPSYVDNIFIHEIIGEKPEWRSLWKDFGLAYYKQGYYAAALYKLDGYLGKVKADDYEALTAAAWSYRWLGTLDKAEASFEAAAKLQPQSDEPHVGLGSTFLAYGKNAESLAAFNRALVLNPRSAIAYNGLAYLYAAQKDDKKTEDALKKCLAIQKDYFDSQAFLANLYLKQKRYEESLKENEKLILLNKNAVSGWNNSGWAYTYMGKYDQAIQAFDRSKQINPYLAEPYYALGLVYAKKGDPDKAKGQMKTAIEIYPYYAHTQDLLALIKTHAGWNDLYPTLGWSYYYKQQYPAALRVFKDYLTIKPNDLEAKRGVAWSNYWINLKEAYAAFQDILKQDENNIDAMVGSGWTLFYLNRDRESMAYLQKAVMQNPKLTNAWRTIAAIHFRSKNFREADEIYKKIAKMEPRALDIRNSQGWALYKEQKYKEAAEKFNDSIRMYRYYGEPHYGLALCYAKTGEIDKAKDAFTTAINLYPAYMDGKELYGIIESRTAWKGLYNTLGWSYYNKYAFDAAKFHFNRMLQLEPNNREAARGLEAIAKVLGTGK